ncbi:protein of unknown function (plasmid) [Azospirillum baldaniorum]|uniref:Uncharacterized protein n=1 Tax=Azospirillum baldaniorum TaxID=1064539 RepID=A0A9P1JXN3_9PROT|nr:protein of unknown function [Azospirillum baldaniorum]
MCEKCMPPIFLRKENAIRFDRNEWMGNVSILSESLRFLASAEKEPCADATSF